MKARSFFNLNWILSQFLIVVSFWATPTRASVVPVEVNSVVETSEAIFYHSGVDEKSLDPVRFIPKTEIRVLKFDGPEDPTANSRYFRVGVFFKTVLNRDLAAMNPLWSGKKLSLAFVTPNSECELTPVDSIRSIVQEVKSNGRDLSAGDEVPICQFRFRIPNDTIEATLANLKKQAENGTLVKKGLSLKLQVVKSGISVPWDTLQTNLRNILGDLVKVPLAKDEAVFLLGLATDQDKTLKNWVWEPIELRDFIDASLAQLFISSENGDLSLNPNQASGPFTSRPVFEEKSYEL